MSFNKVQITRRNTPGWATIFGNSRSMSNWRLISTAGAWLLGIASLYCSLFYVPAFYDFKKAFGMSSRPQLSTQSNSLLAPYLDLLKQNRSFMMSGQSMEAYYKLDAKSKGKLLFYKCQSPIIVEVFSCNPVIVREIPITKIDGRTAIQVQKNGFYGFYVSIEDESVHYDLAWRRVFN